MYVKADPSDHAGSDRADVNGFLPSRGVVGENEGSNSTCRELVQVPHIHVRDEVCPGKPKCSRHPNVLKGC